MALITCNDLELAYGDKPLLDKVSFAIEGNERICILGRNGVGKSTLMKVVQGEQLPDDGKIQRTDNLVVAYLPQDLPPKSQDTVADYVSAGLGEISTLLRKYHEAIAANDLKRMERFQHELEVCDGWSLEQRVESVISKLDLDKSAKLVDLSGGWRRRVALAQALVTDPQILLLDEPTNHLDIEAIQWLEEAVKSFNGAVMFISHDRAFVERVASHVFELDRGYLQQWDCDYQTYLIKREELEAAEAKEVARAEKKLAQEEVWIRKGIKARRTRNEGRVRALEKLRQEKADRRKKMGVSSIAIEKDQASGKRVVVLHNVCCKKGDKTIVKDLTTVIQRGDRIGLVGPNGVGKTTLINLLLKDDEPDSGTVKHGTELSVSYFDQQRAQLDLDKSIMANISEGQTELDIGGKSIHIMSYLSNFLFDPKRAHTPLSALSGGERNRVLLAKIFSKPSNVLVLDEPTNDLDVETLELLESKLADYDGTVILVTHDRAFLDNVVSSCWVFEGEGKITEYIGGYSDWQHVHLAAIAETAVEPSKVTESKPAAKAVPASKVKLSYKFQRELDNLPGQIEQFEVEVETLTAEMAEPDFYQQDQTVVTKKLQALEKLQQTLTEAYARWDELEALQQG